MIKFIRARRWLHILIGFVLALSVVAHEIEAENPDKHVELHKQVQLKKRRH